MIDRTEFDAARQAGLLKQQSRRLAHSLATRIRASQYTHGDGDLTVHDADVLLLAAEILNLGDITDTPRREVATRTADARADPSGHTDLPPTPDALSNRLPEVVHRGNFYEPPIARLDPHALDAFKETP